MISSSRSLCDSYSSISSMDNGASVNGSDSGYAGSISSNNAHGLEQCSSISSPPLSSSKKRRKLYNSDSFSTCDFSSDSSQSIASSYPLIVHASDHSDNVKKSLAEMLSNSTAFSYATILARGTTSRLGVSSHTVKSVSLDTSILKKTNKHNKKYYSDSNNALHSSRLPKERSFKRKNNRNINMKKKRSQVQRQKLSRYLDNSLQLSFGGKKRLSSIKSVERKHMKIHTMTSSSQCTIDQKSSGALTSNKYQFDIEETPIYNVGVDIMSNIMRYLDPTEVHYFLTLPLSITWRHNFTSPQNLWKVLCLDEPFYVKLEDTGNESSDISLRSFPICSTLEMQHLFGRYHLLYISFVKCARYLERIKDDAANGRIPPGINGIKNQINDNTFHKNISLQDFNSKAKEIEVKSHRHKRNSKPAYNETCKSINGECMERSSQSYACVNDTCQSKSHENDSKKIDTVKYGHSKLTQNLLGPTRLNGVPGSVDLPWSCAIYSVVNWMVAFTHVMGIQIMCLKVLPCLLEDEKQRTTAQHAGLTNIVLRSMVLFPDSVILHISAFHTLVLLARPLGDKEGMLFHSTMINSSDLFNVGSSTGKSGIAVMLDSMKRFANDEILQAMSCWSMVNIALIPSQKAVLVKLGGISAAANAMKHHPLNAEVQFRALFALINLVIPTERMFVNSSEDTSSSDQLSESRSESCKNDVLDDETVLLTANLVVLGMKNFCYSEAILNRACLVLHNLSLTEEYHQILLWTPNCYQMLEWCIGNYKNDNVLQQSAGGTLQRLQMTLANDNDLRQSFTYSLRAQQQGSLIRID